MTNIELYINQQLCDTQGPEKLGIRLNRILINPSELSTKDAQYSYSITIPSSLVNDAIFGYTNVEEVKNKFNHNHTAQLYVDSVKIFDGRFILTEIDAEGSYKGNLVVPAKKTVKEIFGDTKMNEIEQAWKLDFSDAQSSYGVLDFTEMINKYNTQEGTPDCIFPLVLYGLLPKVPKNSKGEYTGKTLWDKYVRLGVHDFPPSINCMQTIRKIFGKNKDDDSTYNITGSAFDDERLSKLYMSYKNPADYQQEWNWGHLGKMKLSGSWTNIMNENAVIEKSNLETEYAETKGDYEHVAVNLFRSRNAKINIVEDIGNNIMQSVYKKETDEEKEKETKSEDPSPSPNEEEEKKEEEIVNINSTMITIPTSGLYKIKLRASMKIVNSASSSDKGRSNKSLGLRFAYANSHKANNLFNSARYELKLIRDRASGDFGIDRSVIDGVFYKNNQNQAMDLAEGTDEKYDFQAFKTSPKYFPQAEPDAVLFVDPSQNQNIVSGFRWGKADFKESVNPVDKDGLNCSILAAKNGFSWDKTLDTYNYSAIKSPPYWRYGVVTLGEEEDEANVDKDTVKEFGYEITDLHNVELESPANYIKKESESEGDGVVHSIIWLEKGEHLTLVDVADIGVWRQGPSHKSKGAYIKHEVSFELEIEPYQKKNEWIKINSKGTGTGLMSWTDPTDFLKEHINLVKFLPSNQKIDEWLTSFCNAFNLELTQPEDGKFELNIKESRMIASVPSVLDLDKKASILHRTNQPLGLPSQFQLGFKINKEEEGYIKSKEFNNGELKDGGGSLHTGNIDGAVVSQTSSFSYNWFKEDIVRQIETTTFDEEGEPVIEIDTFPLKLPIITNIDVWEEVIPNYAEMMKKLYTDYNQRFWYKDESSRPYNVGKVWTNNNKETDLLLPRLSENIEGTNVLSLNYYNEPNTILTTYFSIIATDDSNYTYVECYLTPDEYEQLDGTKLVQLNGDLYYITAIEGYDPTGLNKTKLKLMRRV